MKPFKVILWLLALFIVSIAFGAWTTYDYGLRCTKCLVDKHVVEQRLFGITVWHRARDRAPAADYGRIFGHPCQHVFRKGGFGRSWHSLLGSGIACGITGEGSFIRPRVEAISATYDTERRLHDRELALDTFRLIDTLMPPDSQMQHRDALPDKTQSTLFLLSSFLRITKTVEQWRAVLDAARKDFSDTSNLPAE